MSYTFSTNEAGVAIGRDMLFAHGIGVATPDALTAEDALRLGGLDWTIELEQVRRTDRDGDTVDIPGQFHTVRTDADTVLGHVGRRYTPIQNVEMFEWADRLVDDFGAKYEAAWSMYGGTEVGLTMKFPDTVTIGGNDPYAKYLLLRARHDGKGSVLAVVTDVRMRCTNMLNVAIAGATNKVRIPHLTNATRKLAAARETFDLTFKYQEAFEAEMNKLLERELTDGAFKEITKGLLVDQKFGGIEKHADAIVSLRANSNTLDDEYRGTAYGAFQAITEWSDWVRESKSAQGRAVDMLDGRGVRLKTASLATLVG